MNSTERANFPTQTILILVAVSSLITIIWSGWQIIVQPDLGVLWTNQGTVYYAKQNSTIFEGDLILTIDGVPLVESRFPYYSWQRGDIIHLEVQRDGEIIPLQVDYVEKASPLILITRFATFVVVGAFWIVSTLVAFSTYRAQNFSSIFFTFFLWSHALSASLALGGVTSQAWSAHLSLVLIWWAVAFAIHFHLLFPLNRITPKNHKLVLLIYSIPCLGFLRLFTAAEVINLPSAISTIYVLLFYFWVLLGLSAVLFLLINSYQKGTTPATKQQVGVVVVCGFLAITPLLSLAILPEVLLGQAVVSPELTFLFLMAIPIGYGYAITRFQFIKLERYISRSATAVFVICLLCVVYFVVVALLQAFVHKSISQNPLSNMVVIITLVVAYNPLFRRLQNLVDFLLYGGWYDYPSVVGEVTNTLEKNTDIEALADTLSNSIQKTMRVQWACLLWQGRRKNKSIICVAGQTETPAIFENLQLKNLQNITSYFQKYSRPTTSQQIQQALKDIAPTENKILNYSSVRLWVPIRGLQSSMGVLLLGPKYGGDVFDANDMEILEVVSRQASVAFQNVQLINELEAKAYENEQYQKEIIRTREEERKRISRELHDEVIQELVGLKYQIANIQSSLDLAQLHPESNKKVLDLQDEIGELIQTTRSLCHDLRPPALDLGLIPSIRSIVSRFEMKAGIEVSLIIEGDRTIPVGEDVALCLFRCTNEALSNIRKHASAKEICVWLGIAPQQVRLSITDNGQGFVIPERLGSLMEQNHFGLVSMRERIELIEGSFQITSGPSLGTHLEVTIPLKN